MESKKSLRNQVAAAKRDARTLEAQLLTMMSTHVDLVKTVESFDVAIMTHLVAHDSEEHVALCGVETSGFRSDDPPPNGWVCGVCLKISKEEDDRRHNVMSHRLNEIRLLAEQAVDNPSGASVLGALNEIHQLTEPPADMATPREPVETLETEGEKS